MSYLGIGVRRLALKAATGKGAILEIKKNPLHES